MTRCPTCRGDGGWDCGETAELLAMFTEEDRRIAAAVGLDLDHPVGYIECGECEGSGVVTEDRARDIRAADVARVDQALAAFEEREAARG